MMLHAVGATLLGNILPGKGLIRAADVVYQIYSNIINV